MNAKLPLASCASSEADDSVAAALRELADRLSVALSTVDRDPAVALEGVLRAEDELRTLIAGGGRIKELKGVRLATRALADAYWSLFVQAGHAVSRLSVAAACAEALKWNALGGMAPDPMLWERLGSLLRPELEAGLSLIAGDLESVAKHYLRAVSYHAAALDQIDRSLLVPACHLFEMSLPFLAMSRRAPPAPHYLAFPELGMPPRRCLVAPPEAAFHLSTARRVAARSGRPPDRGPAGGSIGGIHAVPSVTSACHWSDEPRCGELRHPMAGRCVGRGKDHRAGEVMRCHVVRWMPAVKHVRSESDSAVDCTSIGELVGVRFEDADLVHLGLVRRLRVESGGVRCGLQLVSRAARTATVEDGRAPAEVLLCGPLARGEAARLIAPSVSVLRDDALFLRAAAAVYKLRPLESSWVGPGFAMRVYQLG